MSQSSGSCDENGQGTVMGWPCLPSNEMSALVFIDDVTASRSIRMNSRVYRAKHAAQCYKANGRCFTVQMDDDPILWKQLRLLEGKEMEYSSKGK